MPLFFWSCGSPFSAGGKTFIMFYLPALAAILLLPIAGFQLYAVVLFLSGGFFKT